MTHGAVAVGGERVCKGRGRCLGAGRGGQAGLLPLPRTPPPGTPGLSRACPSPAYGRCFFQLVLCGYKLEPLVLVHLSERYEVGSALPPQAQTLLSPPQFNMTEHCLRP